MVSFLKSRPILFCPKVTLNVAIVVFTLIVMFFKQSKKSPDVRATFVRIFFSAVVVAQLVERSLPIQRSSTRRLKNAQSNHKNWFSTKLQN